MFQTQSWFFKCLRPIDVLWYFPSIKSFAQLWPRHWISTEQKSQTKISNWINIPIYYIDTSVLLENIPLVKFIKNYIRDPSGLFSIISHVSLSMIWLISSLSLKLYLNSLVYHRNIFGSSSKVFGNLRKSSDIFGNFRKMFRNVRLAFATILKHLRKSSESGRKSSEIHQKRRHQHVYIIKRTLHGGLKIWILFSRGKNNILLTRCARS